MGPPIPRNVVQHLSKITTPHSPYENAVKLGGDGGFPTGSVGWISGIW